MTYQINKNTAYNSIEIAFEHKPSDKIREALKNLKFRWSPKKAIWFGFANEHTVIEAIQNAEQEENPMQTGTIYSDGYMGAIRTDGINSNKRLYGADLTEAIRKHIKQAGIKGVTASRKSYSGGQTLTFKIKFNPDTDLIPFDEYCKSYDVNYSYDYYYNEPGEQYARRMSGEQWFSLSGEEQQKMLRRFAEHDYKRICEGVRLNEFYLTADRYPEYTPEFFKKITAVNSIVTSYRYDDSNGQVDYFETNFYYNLETVPTK